MDKRFHKRAITAATAVMTLTTVVTSVDAAEKNEITIESSRSSVSAGESFDLNVGYNPGATGVSGFTIDLHYDPSAVTLQVPDESSYAPDSKFALVTNFEYADGTVRIVGGSMSGTNIKTETVIANLDFTVNDGYSGDVGFWTEVQDLVYTDGEEFVNAEFTAYGEYTQYTITAEAPVTTTVPETTPTTTEPVTTPEPETQPSETEPEPELPETMIPPETVIIPEVTEPETEPEVPDTALPDETVPEEDDDSTDTQPAYDGQSDGDALFEHKQGGEDFVGETALQYIFSPYDYTEQTGTVDISVTVESDGTASGGIGMQTEEGWKIYSASADGSGETVWTAEDVDLSGVSGSVAVQIYYLEHDSEFKITDISVTSDGEETPAPEEAPAADEYDDQQSEDNGYADGSDDGTETPAPVDTPDEEEQATEAPAEDPETEEKEEQNDAPEDAAAPDAAVPGDADTAEEPAVTEAPSQDAPESDTTTTTVAPASAPSNSSPAAAPAAAASGKDSNPLTGDGFIGRHALPLGIILACLGQIIYSTYRLTRKEQ